MTGRIGPHNHPLPRHAKPDPNPAAARKDADRQSAAGRGQRAPLEPIREEGSQSGSSRESRQSELSSSGSGMNAMNEILGKLGGNWKDIQKDLNMHAEYEKACDRNPFIRAHLDPDIPSPRAGKPKDNWLHRPGLDVAGG